MKFWRADGLEPEVPQLVLRDNGLSSGTVGLASGDQHARIQAPTELDVTYDDVTFLPSVFGDLNVNSILDAGDIDLAIRCSCQRKQSSIVSISTATGPWTRKTAASGWRDCPTRSLATRISMALLNSADFLTLVRELWNGRRMVGRQCRRPGRSRIL